WGKFNGNRNFFFFKPFFFFCFSGFFLCNATEKAGLILMTILTSTIRVARTK
ncbi:hypothetical protein COCVIDRAFT_99577, partial [Bipolaris victoriae FI3]